MVKITIFKPKKRRKIGENAYFLSLEAVERKKAGKMEKMHFPQIFPVFNSVTSFSHCFLSYKNNNHIFKNLSFKNEPEVFPDPLRESRRRDALHPGPTAKSCHFRRMNLLFF